MVQKSQYTASGNQPGQSSRNAQRLLLATQEDLKLISPNGWQAHTVSTYRPNRSPYLLPSTKTLYTQRINSSAVTDGSYGTVSRCVATRADERGRNCDCFYVAVKILRPVQFGGDDSGTRADADRMRKRMLREVKILQGLNHPNVVPVLAFHESPASYDQMFVTPWYTGGTLQNWMRKEQSWSDKLSILEGLGGAILYLHQLKRPLIHGDLKPDNIVIQGQCTPIIVDFGLCSMLKEGVNLDSLDSRPASNRGGNHRWMSPERIADKHVSCFDDTYAFGCIILFVLTSNQPFSVARNEMDFWRLRGQGELPSSEAQFTAANLSYSREWWSILYECWNGIPTSSPVLSVRSSEDGAPPTRTSLDPAWTPMIDISPRVSSLCRSVRTARPLGIDPSNRSTPIPVSFSERATTKKHGFPVPQIQLNGGTVVTTLVTEPVELRPGSRASNRSDASIASSIQQSFRGLKIRVSGIFKKKSSSSLHTPTRV